MDNSPQEATQPLTQPYFDPRRLGRNNSDVSDHDASDVICILAPNSPLAHDAVLATMSAAPQHILQNEDLQDIAADDFLNPEFTPGNSSRDIALRISSRVKNPAAGFVFGRNKSRCDILLVDDEEDRSVSNMHFKIFLNSQGILMLQDTSTNGTIVDDHHLRYKDRQGVRNEKPAMRMIENGSLITVVGKEKAEIKFLVRNPKRGDYEGAFLANLNKFISTRDKSQVAVSATSRQHTYGMHWHGGPHYNVVGLLGKGAFATVYRIATTYQGSQFAAKELDKRKLVKNGVFDMKLDNEIQIMKGLRHPNIVRYIDYHDHEQWVYIIMEYVPHGELSSYMQENGPIPEAQAQIITRQILHALQYLHQRNITHRDIKPDNILIASLEPLVVKLSDFGLSKCVNDEETFLKTFCGTLLYCAPEVYPEYASYQPGGNRKRRRVGEPSRKASPYDQSVDMWSFGAVLFHILCGKAPIMGRGDNKGADMLDNIMTKDVNFDPLRSAGISEEAIDFIGQLLDRNPLSRPNEKECLQHPWIRDIPDTIDYMDEDEAPLKTPSGLEAVEEAEEDSVDEEEEAAYQAVLGLPEVPNDPPIAADAEKIEPRSTAKRRRLSSSQLLKPQPSGQEHQVDIVYPTLPETEPVDCLFRTKVANTAPATRGDRLFGEITPSVLRSSGVLGQIAPLKADVPAIRDRVEQISVNDFVTFNTTEVPPRSEAHSEHQLQYPQALPTPELQSSAPSLLGAEAQIGLLNMASPADTGASEGTTPETTNPLTPKTREMTPSDKEPSLQPPEPAGPAVHISLPRVEFSPLINLNELEDEAAHAALIRAREASRMQMREQKAKTPQTSAESGYHSLAAQLARTVDAQRAKEPVVQATTSAENLATKFEPAPSPSLSYSTNSNRDSFAKPLPRLGKLTTLPGSTTASTIYLSGRMTSWGRDPRSKAGANILHTDKKDVRVPKRALQITFWAPGIEQRIERGENWMKVPGICTIVSTLTSRCIWVNDVELRAQSNEGDARLYGKIYTGDIITIFKSQDPKEDYLKFKVEIGYGDSARKRPENEQGFQVKRETVHHQRALGARSMKVNSKENESKPTTGGATTVHGHRAML
jgi:serine/threonine protein kinase